MTTIGSTAYYAATARYGATEKVTNIIAEDRYAASKTPSGGGSSGTPFSSSDVGDVVDNTPSKAAVNLKGLLFSSTRLADATPIKVSELPDDEYQNFIESDERAIASYRKHLESIYSNDGEIPDFSDYAGIKTYATVVVGGKVVATIDNQGGVVTTDDALGARLANLLVGDIGGKNGPDLAQARAEQMAELLGGRISKADTAITQRQFDALPDVWGEDRVVDYEAMKQDPLYQYIQNISDNLEKVKQERQEFLTRMQ